MADKVRVLFCCMGNICRSPLAQGVFEKLVREAGLESLIEVDSAGTHGYHVGEAPDPRAAATAQRRGIDLCDQRARKYEVGDFQRFDFILAMDRDNLEILLRACPAIHAQKVRLFLDFAPHKPESEVPDPYYGGQAGFERVYALVEAAGHGLLEEIRRARPEIL